MLKKMKFELLVGAAIGAVIGYVIGDVLGVGVVFAMLHKGMAGRHLFMLFGAVIGYLVACCRKRRQN